MTKQEKTIKEKLKIVNFVLGDKHIPFETENIEGLSFPTELEYNGEFYQLASVDKTSLTGFYRQIEIKFLMSFTMENNLKRIRNHD